MIQQSVKSDRLKCKYYIECEFKTGSKLGNTLPKIVIPVNIYYHNNMYADMQIIKQTNPIIMPQG